MKLSASRLTTFSQCQLKYHFNYHLKLPKTSITPRAVLGLAVHKALEIFYREFRYQELVLPTLDYLEQCYQRAWQQYRKDLNGDEYQKQWQLGWQGLTAYYYRHVSSDGGQTGRFESPFLVEQRFRARVQVNGFWLELVGRIDRLDWSDYQKASLRLIEYKTSRRAPVDDRIDDRFRIQLGFYQWAIQQIYGYGLQEISYHYLLAGKEITYRCEPEYRRQIEAVAGLVIETENWPDDESSWRSRAKLGEHCQSCDYLRYCSAANPKAEALTVKPPPKQLRLF